MKPFESLNPRRILNGQVLQSVDAPEGRTWIFPQSDTTGVAAEVESAWPVGVCEAFGNDQDAAGTGVVRLQEWISRTPPRLRLDPASPTPAQDAACPA
jgi:hypothetical protein